MGEKGEGSGGNGGGNWECGTPLSTPPLWRAQYARSSFLSMSKFHWIYCMKVPGGGLERPPGSSGR